MCLHIQESRLRTISGSVECSGRHICAYKSHACTFLRVVGFEETLQKSTFFDFSKLFCTLWPFISILLTYNYQNMIPSTHPFFQGEWHFPENPKIDGDTAQVLKSGKILNHRGARARIRFFKK